MKLRALVLDTACLFAIIGFATSTTFALCHAPIGPLPMCSNPTVYGGSAAPSANPAGGWSDECQHQTRTRYTDSFYRSASKDAQVIYTHTMPRTGMTFIECAITASRLHWASGCFRGDGDTVTKIWGVVSSPIGLGPAVELVPGPGVVSLLFTSRSDSAEDIEAKCDIYEEAPSTTGKSWTSGGIDAGPTWIAP